jgi:hypothetical protein
MDFLKMTRKLLESVNRDIYHLYRMLDVFVKRRNRFQKLQRQIEYFNCGVKINFAAIK